jgi:hypothetical protein
MNKNSLEIKQTYFFPSMIANCSPFAQVGQVVQKEEDYHFPK